MKIIGVTKCPVGVAHTYMAAEKIEMVLSKLGFEVKIETQGLAGIENKLTHEDIETADYVIIASDCQINNIDRFIGKKVLEVPISFVLRNSDKLYGNLKEASTMGGTKDKKDISSDFKQIPSLKQLMNGISHMLPFVIVGGLFIALSIAMGGTPGGSGISIKVGSIWDKINQIGTIGFNLMIPIFAGFIAFSIAGRAALAPAMICAQVANTPSILGTSAGTGFLGTILVGYMAGYLVKFINTWKVPKSIKPVMPIFVIPILSVSIISILLILLLGGPISWLMGELQNLLNILSTNKSTSIILGLILGGMIAIDMGGPINKVAFLFGVASISTGNTVIMGAVACAIPIPPLAMGLAAFLEKDIFNEDEHAASIPAILMGFIGITEGAIPFASADPKRVLPSIIVGSAISSALSMVLGITSIVPSGGPIVGFLGATNNIVLFLLVIFVGTAIAAFMTIFFKRRRQKI